ncbi:CFC-like protein, partial [Mya arenaria]
LCGTLTDISVSTGKVTLSTNGSQSVATYNCPDGYKVKGASILTCGPDGTWDAEPSDCVCETPSPHFGGTFNVSVDGMTVAFSCNAGYTLVGAQTVTCDQNGGGWASTLPNCSKNS